MERIKSVPALISIIIVALLLIGGFGWRFLGAGTGGAAARPLTAEEKAKKDFLTQKAAESGGEFSKLSPEDQRRLIADIGPTAPYILSQTARPVKVGP